MRGEGDPDLRRFERDAVLAGAATTVGAGVVTGGRWDVAAGAAGGALLMALCYGAVKGGVDAFIGRRPAAGRDAAGGEPGGEADDARLPVRERVRGAVKFFTRYALLAVGAYVMLSCFRLHPAGLLAGAVSPFLAAVLQVARLARRHPL